MYVSIIYLHRQAGKMFGACGREKNPLDEGHGASIVYTRVQDPNADM